MRILIAGIAGGIVMFIWSAVAHMVLPIGEVGFRQMPNEAAVIAPLKNNINESGIYMVPGMDMQNATEAEQAAWAEKYKAGPRAFVIFHPMGAEPMGPGMLLTELASNIFASLCGALILSWLICTFLGRVAAAGLIGLAAWLSIVVSMWNWYGFPGNYTLAQGVEQTVGWLLAGLAIAWLLERRGTAVPALSPQP
ncbi:MAG: hypothetical protein H7070_16270 [Saprospiraceae bacterium]|nr:hypothetical protein [Pyrinomonadaceae bacterium]